MRNVPLIPFDSRKASDDFVPMISLEREGTTLYLNYLVEGSLSNLKIPQRSIRPNRVEGIYEHTCCELFVLGDSGKYMEWNFSPGLDWCTFAFDSYRKRNEKNEIEKLHTFRDLFVQQTLNELSLSVAVDLKSVLYFLGSADKLKAQVSMVLESSDKKISYWALKHAPKKADFHCLECFVEI